jgi:hypothetical protein
MPDAFHDKNPLNIYTLELPCRSVLSIFFFSQTA